MELLKKIREILLGGGQDQHRTSSRTDKSLTASDRAVMVASAQRIASVMVESIEIAQKSNNAETKRSRLSVARTKLDELKRMIAAHPFLSADGLEKAEGAITQMEIATAARTIRLGDDESYLQNRDIIAGLEFDATLQLRIPLSVLEHHGELFEGPPSAAPRYGSEEEGLWVPKLRPLRELGFDLPDLPPDLPMEVMASDIGPVEASYYLPFLKDFRRIVEQEVPLEKKLASLQDLRQKSTSYREIWGRLEKAYKDFPESFFHSQLLGIPGIGPQAVRNLWRAGFRSLEQLFAASDSELMAVPGIGKAALKKIRDCYSRR